jgi:hypothetical protein
MFFEKDMNKEEMIDFYMNQIEIKLKDYEPGRPNMKPDVLKQMIEIEKTRKIEEEKMMVQYKQQQQQLQQQQQQQQNNIRIMLTINGQQQAFTIEQIVGILQQQQGHINHLGQLLQGKDMEINVLTNELTNLKSSTLSAASSLQSAPLVSSTTDAAPSASDAGDAASLVSSTTDAAPSASDAASLDASSA